MDLMELINVDKGLSVILSMLVISVIVMAIKNLPSWVEKIIAVFEMNAIATSNNTAVMQEVKTVFADTKDMHVIMDTKMNEMSEEIAAIKGLLTRMSDDDRELKVELKDRLERLENEIVLLKKSGNPERGDFID